MLSDRAGHCLFKWQMMSCKQPIQRKWLALALQNGLFHNEFVTYHWNPVGLVHHPWHCCAHLCWHGIIRQPIDMIGTIQKRCGPWHHNNNQHSSHYPPVRNFLAIKEDLLIGQDQDFTSVFQRLDQGDKSKNATRTTGSLMNVLLFEQSRLIFVRLADSLGLI